MASLHRLTVWPFPRKCPIRPSAGSTMCGPSRRWRALQSRPGGRRSGRSRSWCPPCPSPPCPAAASSTWTTTCRCWGRGVAGGAGGQPGASPTLPSQVSLKAPEATVTLPVFIGDIAVNHAPLSPWPGAGLPAGASPPVVPSAPPQEEAEAGGPHFPDPIFLSTKSHSQQQPPRGALGCAPGVPEPHPPDGSPAPHPLPPPLCISTGATVPYFAEGSGGPVPTTSTLILPPEYSSWGYPYGEWGARAWRGGGVPGRVQTSFFLAEAPPSYEQSCGGADPGLTPGS